VVQIQLLVVIKDIKNLRLIFNCFCFAKRVNNCLVLPLIKCDLNYKGVYQALFNLISKEEGQKEIKFINFTNLTRKEGLRNHKINMKPIKYLKPHGINIKEQIDESSF